MPRATAALSMPKTHPADLRLRAVALAEATDAPTAAKHFGIAETTLSKWMAEAPDRTALERAAELALSEATVRMAKGDASQAAKNTVVMSAILQDKMHRYSKPKVEEEPSDPTGAWIDRTHQGAAHELVSRVYDHWLDAEIHRLEDEIARLDRGEPVDDAEPADPDESFRRFLAATPDLEAWLAEHLAEKVRRGERERAVSERVAELVKAGMSWQEARPLAENPPELDPDTLALIERAEAYLKGDPA